QTGGVEDLTNITITHYVLDAEGNQLSIYEEKHTNGDVKLKQEETAIYGSDRLGVVDYSISRLLYTAIPPVYQRTNVYEHQLGKKIYEIENHLGNVITTVTDWKTAVDDGVYDLTIGTQTSTVADGAVDYFEPIIVSATDYYPFGMPMPGRSFTSSTGYRYGFGGQEMDNEISGQGNMYTAEYWEYDARLGRRWNTDPIIKDWESPYSCFSNNPIYFNDPSGADKEPPSSGDENTCEKYSSIVPRLN
ncbi:MAG TPA: hypothetical protein VI621_04620, partial [Flavobacterium sp.]|nr:hypothetical protein [Flavobacterium sp.]